MLRLTYLDDAKEQITAIADHIARESGSGVIARNFVSRIRERCERLAALGGTMGTERPDIRPGLRSTPSDGYLIFFRYRPEELVVVAIVHGSRDVASHFGEH